MKRYFLYVLLVFLIISCKTDSDKIGVGVILPLTGNRASFGQSSKSGIDLAFKELDINNDIYSTQFEDSKGESKTSVSAANKLIATGSKIIIGPISSSEVLSITPITEKNEVILFTPGASSPKISSSGPFTFRNVPSDIFEGSLMANFAFDSLGFNNIAILYNNSEYGNGVKTAFKDAFQKKGGQITLESFSDGANDFRTQLTKIKMLNPDAIYFVGYLELGNMVKQASELGIDCQYLTTAIFEDESILNSAANSAEGIIFTSITFDLQNQSPRAIRFIENYRKTYNKQPDGYAAVAYDAVYLIDEAIKITATKNIPMNEAFHEIKDFNGLLGILNFDKNGDVILPIKLKTVKNNKFINYYNF